MSVQIAFRGVMLFECFQMGDERRLKHVLLPDGDEPEDAQKKWKTGGKHPDGSEAYVHHAGLVFEARNALEVVHVPLRGRKVKIFEVNATEPTSVTLDGLPKLRYAVSPDTTVDPEYEHATVEIYGGALTASPPLPDGIVAEKFGESDVTHHGALLTCTKWTRTLGDGDKLAVYNYETRFPSIWDLDAVGTCVLNMDEDHDFKWLYSLLGKHPQKLSAPRITCPNDDKLWGFITIFTCFPAVWEGD
jgi:hypothetical protein